MPKPTCAFLALCCLCLAISTGRADPKPAQDPTADALPAKAKGRLGMLRLHNNPEQFALTMISGDGKRLVRFGNSDEVQIIDPLTGQDRSKVKLYGSLSASSQSGDGDGQ